MHTYFLLIFFVLIILPIQCDDNFELREISFEYNNYLVQVDINYLVELFDCKDGRSAVYRRDTYLSEFPNLIILFDAQEDSFEDLAKILLIAAKFNSEHSHADSFRKVTIWTDICDDKVNSSEVNKFLDAIHQANSLFSLTVTTIVIGGLDVSSLHEIITEEVPKLFKLISKHEAKSVAIGLAMSENSTNCSLVHSLNSQYITYYTMPAFDKENNTNDYSNCQLLSFEETANQIIPKLAMVFDVLVYFDFDKKKSTYFSDKNTEIQLINMENVLSNQMVIPILNFDQDMLKVVNTNQNDCESLSVIQSWLQNDTTLSRKQISFSMYFDSKILQPGKLISAVVSEFSVVVFENVYALDSSSEKHLKHILQAALEVLNTLKMNTSKSFLNDVQVLIKLNFFKEQKILEYEMWFRRAITIAIETNSKLQGFVQAVVVNLIGDKKENTTDQIHTYNHLFTRILNDHGFNMFLPRLGATVPWTKCKNIDVVPEKANLILFEFFAQTHQCCYKEERKYFEEILENCIELSKDFSTQDRGFLFYVTVQECQRNQSEIHQLSEYGLFVEYLNSFAILQNIKVVVSPAFEANWVVNDDVFQRKNPCSSLDVYRKKKIDDIYTESCSCGWWRVFANPKNMHEYIILNKKSVSSNFFKIPGSKPTTNPDMQPVQKSTTTTAGYIVLYTLLSLVALAISTATIIIALRYRSKDVELRAEAHTFFHGEQTKEDEKLGDRYIAMSLKYDRKMYDVSRRMFEIDESKCLGAGEFGMVYAGVITRNEQNIKVAVKMLRPGTNRKCDVWSLRGILTEIKILTYIGSHPHIVSLVGAYTDKIGNGYVLAFLELCSMGSLEKYLRGLAPSSNSDPVNEESSCNYANLTERSNLDPQLFHDLFTWTLQIAEGLEYIAAKNIVHADIATRNVLLDCNKTAKIADFGLSRRLYNYTHYVKTKQEPLPWRWMAPESLKRLELSEKSDVWAFGVTAWEIYSLGDTPYPGLSWDIEFPTMLETGLKPAKPKYDDRNLYAVLLQCWKVSARQRPTFSELRELLNSCTHVC